MTEPIPIDAELSFLIKAIKKGADPTMQIIAAQTLVEVLTERAGK